MMATQVDNILAAFEQRFKHISKINGFNTNAGLNTFDNREMISWLVGYWKKQWPYDCVIIDESSSFKNPKAIRFKALSKVLPFIDRLVALTGTPASNGLLDLWSQIYLLDQGARLGKTFYAYQSRYFEQDYSGYRWTIRQNAKGKIEQKLQDICLTLASEDYLSLPDFIERDILIKLPDALKEQYSTLESELLLELEEDKVTAANAAAKTNKLRQFCNGAVYAETKTHNIHALKLDALDDILEAAAGKPVLVAYNYISDKERIKQRFKYAVDIKDDKNVINRWNKKEIKLLIAHPASAGHGLNLQSGGHIIVWFGLSWSLELVQQFNARLYRQGQTQPVMVYYLLIADSIDLGMKEAILKKDATQASLLNRLKSTLLSKQS
ncbi:MAG: DEAD/DEAH box helicase [Methylococcales bacterium]|nr:DEAD/DEAH box helicase [Methylococcales bacterium]